MYCLYNGHTYIGLDSSNAATSVSNIKKALLFSERQKAVNYLDNLKTTLKKFGWEIIEVKIECDEENTEENTCDEFIEYVETDLEREGFNIGDFFKTTIEIMSQLKEYASNMHFLEKEYNNKILDVRHYKRDAKTKLNAIQLQRLEQFEIQLERERYECKSNRMIAEIFLTDFNRVGDMKYIEIIRNIKESEYKPKVFTYELLDKIVGKRGNI